MDKPEMAIGWLVMQSLDCWSCGAVDGEDRYLAHGSGSAFHSFEVGEQPHRTGQIHQHGTFLTPSLLIPPSFSSCTGWLTITIVRYE